MAFSDSVNGFGHITDNVSDRMCRISYWASFADESIIAVLRILLNKRLPNDATFRTDIWDINRGGRTERGGSLAQNYYVNAIERNNANFSVYFMHSNCLTDDYFRNFVDYMSVNYGITVKENDILGTYLRQEDVLRAHCYTVEDQCGIDRAVLICNVDTQHINKNLHTIASVIPSIFPNLFKDNPVDDEERAMLTALGTGTYDDFVEKMNVLINRVDWRIEMLEDYLTDFDTDSKEIRINDLAQRISNDRNSIEEYERMITNLCREIEQYQNELIGISFSDKKRGTDTLDYFKANKSLHLLSRNGRRIRFTVRTPLDNYDIDLVDAYFDNPNSLFNDRAVFENYRRATYEQWIRLLTAIFKEQKIKLMMGASFTLDFGTNAYSTDTDATGRYSALHDTVPNPHLKYYVCFGDNGREIARSLRENNSIMALSLCVNTTGNINFAESFNVANLIGDINRRSHLNIFRLEDGTEVNLANAIKYLEGESK